MGHAMHQLVWRRRIVAAPAFKVNPDAAAAIKSRGMRLISDPASLLPSLDSPADTRSIDPNLHLPASQCRKWEKQLGAARPGGLSKYRPLLAEID